MRPQDAQEKVLELAPLLDAKTMGERLREYQRGGLPGSSFTDGRGGEPPLPLLGTVDRQIQSARLEYEQSLRHAAVALETAVRLQRFWCEPLLTDAEKESKLAEAGPKGSGTCANVWCATVCSGLGNDRLRHGRCRACYRVWKLEGRDRDPRKELAT